MNVLSNVVSSVKALPAAVRWGGLVVSLVLIVLMSRIYTNAWLPGIVAAASAAAVIGIFYAVGAVMAYREKKASEGLDADLRKQSDSVGGDSDALEDLRRQWGEASTEIKRSGLSLYELPWYVLIGEPQSGKSTTLRNSGLEFPVGTESLSGVGGTRNCDWWFTNDAVILDTAGRFTFEEANAPDASEWREFLRLLRRHRPRCPINGVIVTIPADSLLKGTLEERQEKARIIRDKLQHMERELEVQFPVYVLITKCDLMMGFAEFFWRLPAKSRKQLFGWSNPAPITQAYDPEGLGAELSKVRDQLDKWRTKWLADALPGEELDRLYSFPDEFGSVVAPITDYISEIFSPNRYADPLFLRGIYFTSGLQKGKPILRACAELIGIDDGKEDVQDLAMIFEKSRSFFIRDFYRQKVFPEKGLVTPTRSSMAKRRVYERVLNGFCITAAAVVLLGLIAWVFVISSRFKDVEKVMAKSREASTLREKLIACEDLHKETGEIEEGSLDPGPIGDLFSLTGKEDVKKKLAERMGVLMEEVIEEFGSELALALESGPSEDKFNDYQAALVSFTVLSDWRRAAKIPAEDSFDGLARQIIAKGKSADGSQSSDKEEIALSLVDRLKELRSFAELIGPEPGDKLPVDSFETILKEHENYWGKMRRGMDLHEDLRAAQWWQALGCNDVLGWQAIEALVDKELEGEGPLQGTAWEEYVAFVAQQLDTTLDHLNKLTQMVESTEREWAEPRELALQQGMSEALGQRQEVVGRFFDKLATNTKVAVLGNRSLSDHVRSSQDEVLRILEEGRADIPSGKEAGSFVVSIPGEEDKKTSVALRPLGMKAVVDALKTLKGYATADLARNWIFDGDDTRPILKAQPEGLREGLKAFDDMERTLVQAVKDAGREKLSTKLNALTRRIRDAHLLRSGDAWLGADHLLTLSHLDAANPAGRVQRVMATEVPSLFREHSGSTQSAFFSHLDGVKTLVDDEWSSHERREAIRSKSVDVEASYQDQLRSAWKDQCVARLLTVAKPEGANGELESFRHILIDRAGFPSRIGSSVLKLNSADDAIGEIFDFLVWAIEQTSPLMDRYGTQVVYGEASIEGIATRFSTLINVVRASQVNRDDGATVAERLVNYLAIEENYNGMIEALRFVPDLAEGSPERRKSIEDSLLYQFLDEIAVTLKSLMGEEIQKHFDISWAALGSQHRASLEGKFPFDTNRETWVERADLEGFLQGIERIEENFGPYLPDELSTLEGKGKVLTQLNLADDTRLFLSRSLILGELLDWKKAATEPLTVVVRFKKKGGVTGTQDVLETTSHVLSLNTKKAAHDRWTEHSANPITWEWWTDQSRIELTMKGGKTITVSGGLSLYRFIDEFKQSPFGAKRYTILHKVENNNDVVLGDYSYDLELSRPVPDLPILSLAGWSE